MAGIFDEADVINYGEPLPNYTRGQEGWPPVWRDMEISDEADMYDKVAALTDNVLLREAIHCWDNCLRLPDSAEGVMAGILGALVRFAVALNPDPAAFEEFCDGVSESMRAMGKIAREQLAGRADEEE